MSDREHLAAAIDPQAFDESVKRSKQPAALIQWAARRKMAFDAADAVLASDWLAAHDDALAATAKVADAGERIAQAIEAEANTIESSMQFMQGLCRGASIARAALTEDGGA